MTEKSSTITTWLETIIFVGGLEFYIIYLYTVRKIDEKNIIFNILAINDLIFL